MYKKDLVLNNLQWTICHKTKPTKQTSAMDFRIKTFSLPHFFVTPEEMK